MISPSTVESIKARIDILDVLGDFIRLKRRGSNYLGLCPFHGEKTPSFTVSPAKEIYKCFGCGKSGNTITFLMEHEKLSYTEALQWLARRYNIEIEETFSSDEERQARMAGDSLMVLNQFAAKWFAEQLHSDEGKSVALSYLYDRGFTDEIIAKFNIGYCPTGNAFVHAAKEAQYTEAVLLKSGLAVQRSGQLADNYRERIIFPIHNNSGKIIGFGARVIGSPQKAPKYINTPENELYVKSRVLYGIYQGRQEIDKQDECLLVEGYTDVTSMHQAGIENVVASGGTSLTTDQLRLITKYSRNLTIVYDGDAAGIKAALRGLDMALEEGLHVRVVLVPDGEDPDSYAKKHGGEAFRQMVAERKKDFVLFQLEVLLKDAGNDVAKRSEAANKIAETLSKLSRPEDLLKYQDYLRRCAGILQMDEANLSAMVASYRRQAVSDSLKKSERVQANEQGQLLTMDSPQEAVAENEVLLAANEKMTLARQVIRVLVEHGSKPIPEEDGRFMAEYIFAELEDYPPEDDDSYYVLDAYRRLWQAGERPTATSLAYHPDETVRRIVADVTSFRHELSPGWSKMTKGVNNLEEDPSWDDVKRTVLYHKLGMIKPWLAQHQELLKSYEKWEDVGPLLEVHNLLKQAMKQLATETGTVIIR